MTYDPSCLQARVFGAGASNNTVEAHNRQLKERPPQLVRDDYSDEGSFVYDM